MITLDQVYVLAGLILAGVTVLVLRDRTNPRRLTTALFWGLYAAAFLLGSHIPAFWNGILGIALAVVVGFGGVRVGRHVEATAEEREARATTPRQPAVRAGTRHSRRDPAVRARRQVRHRRAAGRCWSRPTSR